MRTIDISLRVLTVVMFIGFFVFPEALVWALVCVNFFSMGVWAVMFPSGILEWAKTGHRDLDPSDKAIWWVPRLIGAVFIVMSVFLAVMLLLHRPDAR